MQIHKEMYFSDMCLLGVWLIKCSSFFLFLYFLYRGIHKYIHTLYVSPTYNRNYLDQLSCSLNNSNAIQDENQLTGTTISTK